MTFFGWKFTRRHYFDFTLMFAFRLLEGVSLKGRVKVNCNKCYIIVNLGILKRTCNKRQPCDYNDLYFLRGESGFILSAREKEAGSLHKAAAERARAGVHQYQVHYKREETADRFFYKPV